MPSNPGFIEGEIPSADQWNNAFAAKVDSPLPIATESAPGLAQADGTTITSIDGVFSAVNGGSGNVTGPSSASVGHLAVFSNTDGKQIEDGGAIPTAAFAAPGILSARVSTAVNNAPFSDDPLLTGPQWPIETFAPRGTPVDGRTDWTSYFAAAVASGEIIKLDKAGYVVSQLAVGGAGVLTRFVGNGNSLIRRAPHDGITRIVLPERDDLCATFHHKCKGRIRSSSPGRHGP